MDDFFLQPHQRTKERFLEVGGNIDRERFLDEVLIPLNNNEIVKYHIFDCSTMSLGECIEVSPKKVTIIEGAYSMHKELSSYYLPVSRPHSAKTDPAYPARPYRLFPKAPDCPEAQSPYGPVPPPWHSHRR